MPIGNITQTISELPAAGKRGIDVQTIFVTKQEDFQDHLQGTTVTELNTLKDQLNTRIGEINSTATTMNGYASTASTSASTATTKAGEASTSASEALTSRNQASIFATNSSNSATKASQWADNNYNVEVAAGRYSAKHWSTVAQNIVSGKVDKVTSTDNAIVRFDGVTGAVQNSGVVIDDNNNVGIGVTPSAWRTTQNVLELPGGVSLSNFNSLDNITISSNMYINNSNQPIYKNNGYATRYTQSATHQWVIAPSGTAGNPITWTNAMTLDTSGNLYLNADNTVSGKFAVIHGGATGSYLQLYGRNVVDTQPVLTNFIGGVVKSAILANGTYQSATNVYGSTSDIKLKENIVDTSPKLDKLMKVQVRNFNYIGLEDSKQIGVIAQEIEQIFPSVVFETKDTKQIEVQKERVILAVEEVKDEEGNVITEAKPESIEEYIEIENQETGEVTKNVKYSVLYMIAIKALQELNAKVEAMQLEINELKGAI